MNNNNSNNNNILKTAVSSCNIPSAVHGAADSCEDGDDEEEEPSFSALPPAGMRTITSTIMKALSCSVLDKTHLGADYHF